MRNRGIRRKREKRCAFEQLSHHIVSRSAHQTEADMLPDAQRLLKIEQWDQPRAV